MKNFTYIQLNDNHDHVVLPKLDPRFRVLLQTINLSPEAIKPDAGPALLQEQFVEGLLARATVRVFAIPEIVLGEVYWALGSVKSCLQMRRLTGGDGGTLDNGHVLLRISRVRGRLFEAMYRVWIDHGVDATRVAFEYLQDPPISLRGTYEVQRAEAIGEIGEMANAGVQKDPGVNFYLEVKDAAASTSMVTCTAWATTSPNKTDSGTKSSSQSTAASLVGRLASIATRRVKPTIDASMRSMSPGTNSATSRHGTTTGSPKRGLVDGIVEKIKPTKTSSATLRHLRDILDLVWILFEKHRQRGKEVDDLDADSFVQYMKKAAAPTEEESKLVQNSVKLADTTGWKLLPGSLSSITKAYKRVAGIGGEIWGKVTTVVDVNAEKVAARLWLLGSNNRVEQHILNDGKVPRFSVNIPNSHSCLYHRVTTFGSAAKNRYFESWNVWILTHYKGRPAIVIAICPMDEYKDARLKYKFGLREKKGYIKGRAHGVQIITEVAPEVCELIYVNSFDLGGSIPQKIIEWKLPQQLIWARNLQEELQRNDKVVDAEIRMIVVDRMRKSDALHKLLNDEQMRFMVSCSEVKKSKLVSRLTMSRLGLNRRQQPRHIEWVKDHSDDHMVNIFHRRIIDGVPTTRVETILDCSAEVAALYCFDRGSREYMRRYREAGIFAIPVVNELAENDIVSTEVHTMHFPYAKLEFLTRRLLASRNQGESWFVAAAPFQRDGYGQKRDCVRASYLAFVDIQRLGQRQCKITIHQQVDAGDTFFKSAVNSVLNRSSINWIYAMRDDFARDEEVDIAELLKMKTHFLTKRSIEPNDLEIKTALRCLTHFKNSVKDADDWINIAMADPFVSLESKVDIHKNRNAMIYRASLILDAEVEDCVAWELSKKSREQMKIHRECGGRNRTFSKRGDFSFDFSATYEAHKFTREERFFIVLDQVRDTIAVNYYPSELEIDDPEDSVALSQQIASLFTRGTRKHDSNIARWYYEPQRDVRGISQTRATVFVKKEIPSLHLAREHRISDKMKYISRMRQRFDRSREIDAHFIAVSVKLITEQGQDYTKDEMDEIKQGLTYLELFEGNKNVKSVRSGNPTIENRIAFKEGENLPLGQSIVTVRAKKEVFLAFMWNICARSRWSQSDIKREVLEKVNAHHEIHYLCKRGVVKSGLRFLNREGVSSMLWKRLDDGSLILVGTPTKHSLMPIRSDQVRAQMPVACRITDVSNGFCKAVYVNKLDMSGDLPKVAHNFFINLSLAVTSRAQRHFQRLRQFEDWDGEDGKSIAEFMLMKVKEETHRKKGESKVCLRMRVLFREMDGLRALRERHVFVEAMMTKVIECRLRPAKDVARRLVILSIKDGETIGSAFAGALATNTLPESAVDEWIVRYPALKEIDMVYVWFRPMMNVLAKRLLSEVNFGLKFRIFAGAVLSTIDVVTDYLMISRYLVSDSQGHYGWALLAMVCTCIFLELLVVFTQNRSSPKRAARETICVLTGLKPVVDAYYVASGQEMDKHQVFNPLIELWCTKVLLMFSQSIPGSVLQMYALLKQVRGGEYISRVAVGSVCISLWATGFTAAMLSYDFDTDPGGRRTNPAFYGFIKDDSRARTVMFILLIVISTCVLATRSLSLGLLVMVDANLVGMYIGGDLIIYLAQKILRNDFFYWVPVEGALNFIASFLMRVIIKVISDNTSVVQLRHPHEVGGIYWSVSMVAAFVATFGSVHVFGLQRKDLMKDLMDDDDNDLSIDDLWSATLGLAGVWMFSFILLLAMMEPKYRRTFVSTQTGLHLTQSYFKDGRKDEVRAIIFEKNTKHWKKDIGRDVKKWVQENWETWTENKPEWLTDAVKAKIPLEYIPIAEDRMKVERMREDWKLETFSRVTRSLSGTRA